MTAGRFVALVLVVAVLGGCAGTATPFESTSPVAPAGSRPAPAGPSPARSGGLGGGASASPSGAIVPGSGSPTPGPATPGAGTTGADWPVYHRDARRTGYEPAFPSPGTALHIAWSARLDGAVYAEPLVIGGSVIAATENDSVYALDGSTGAVRWRRNLGAPVPLSSLPCGNIDPLGITGTPAYDPGTSSLFAVAEVAGPRHVLFALDASSGAVRSSRSIDLPGDDPATHQQRPALAVANGYVYVGMGGLDGDCGQYRGEVVGVPVDGRGPTLAYRVPTSRMGAVWATAGPAVDDAGHLYVSVGNGGSTTAYDGTDSVLELSPTLQLLSRFAPSTWAADNAGDADLGSMGPVLVPGGYVFIAGKSGTAYTLRQGSLGGIGGQIASAPLCRAFGGAAVAASTVFVPCADGLRAVHIGPDGSIHPLWRTSSGANGSPVASPGIAWSLDLVAGVLYALDASTGSAIARVAVGDVPHFASPALWQGRVLVGTMRGVVAVVPG